MGEPAWPSRSAAEFREAARHEALCNLALVGVPMIALCPYDAARLPASVLAAARQTHPLLARPAGLAPSPAFLGPVHRGRCRQSLAYDAGRVTRDVDARFVPPGIVLDEPGR